MNAYVLIWNITICWDGIVARSFYLNSYCNCSSCLQGNSIIICSGSPLTFQVHGILGVAFALSLEFFVCSLRSTRSWFTSAVKYVWQLPDEDRMKHIWLHSCCFTLTSYFWVISRGWYELQLLEHLHGWPMLDLSCRVIPISEKLDNSYNITLYQR